MTDTKPSASPWDFIQPWDTELMGPEILDEKARWTWSTAFAIAGGLPYIWKDQARQITEIAYGLLELREGDKVLIIGECIEPIGWDEEIRQIVGPDGAVDTHEIILEARQKVGGGHVGRNGMSGAWEWEYTKGVPDEHYDCVAILQATHHADDWSDIGGEMLRVMKPGRRIVFAEATLGGSEFYSRVNADVHLRQWFQKIQGDRKHPHYSGEDVLEAFGDRVTDPQCMEWRGIEMFWGRKAS